MTQQKSLLFFLLFSLVLMLSTGCRKTKISETDYPDFIGLWYAVEGTDADIEFNIEPGVAQWIKYQGAVTSNVDGVPKISPKRDILKVFVKKFKIDAYPAEDDGVWQMTLDGITYERY